MMIERPDHYANSGEIRDYVVADDWRLPQLLGNVLKYLKRYRHKGHPVADLNKAIDCIKLQIEQLESEAHNDAAKHS